MTYQPIHGSTAIKLLIDALAAFGTCAVAVLAIWGDWFRSKLVPVKLKIVPHVLRGDPTKDQFSKKLMYYHLKVVNLRPWVPAENCRVLLRSMTKRGPDGQFRPIHMSIPLQFVWAPAEITPAIVTLVKEQIFDFGLVAEDDRLFVPRLFNYPFNFQGVIGANEAVRFYLQVDGTNFHSSKYQVFQVAWDGQWNYEPEQMANHLVITELSESLPLT
jgi:hypothetical protein